VEEFGVHPRGGEDLHRAPVEAVAVDAARCNPGRFVAGIDLLCVSLGIRDSSLQPVAILTRRRQSRWAESRGFRLVSFSTVPFYEGPRAWRRNRYKFDYRVVVEAQSGVRREGWLLEDRPFLDLGRPKYEVQWDDVS
jgi:hypothetical protein